MLTSGEWKKVTAAVAEAAANLLAREGNESLSAEDLAEELATTVTETVVAAYEEIQAKSYNLVVLGHFHLEEGKPYVAAVGPLSTRAPMRARGVGERFAWDYKSRTGTGKFSLVPLIRDPNQAWEEARAAAFGEYVHHLTSITPGVEPSYEPMRLGLDDSVRAQISAQWEMDQETLLRKFGPVCICGMRGEPACPRHPEGRAHGEGPDRAG